VKLMQMSGATYTKRMTITYVGVLVAVAVLAAVGFYLQQAELKAQQSSAAVQNRIDHQNTLLYHTALLAESFVTAPSHEQRQQFREELLRALARMEAAHSVIVAGDPRLEVPAELDREVRDYLAKVQALAALPEAELGLDNPLFRVVLGKATGQLAEGLESVAQEYQRRDEAGIRRLRRVASAVLAGKLAVLALLGVFVFRPMVRRVRQEHEERVRSERLAVIGTMAAKFAHEIRNPLGSIRLNLDSVREGHAAPALLESIDSEARRIERISDGYLQFARLPKGERGPVNLSELVRQAAAFVEAQCRRERVTVQTECTGELPAVQADRAQLWQALLNLIRNAVEAMPGGGTLTLRTARNGTAAMVSVSDTGSGMSDEVTTQLYKPFFTTKQGGTGLGLALTQQIVAEHDGRIDFETKPGSGTTFTLSLPLTNGGNP
jgi:signal transduction histidine kinase